MGRGKKKDAKMIEEPKVIQNIEPVVPPVPAHEPVAREPVYIVADGQAISTLSGIIDEKTRICADDKPGQIRPRYVPCGEETLLKLVAVGLVVKS